MEDLLKVLKDNRIDTDLIDICKVATLTNPITESHQAVQEVARREIMLGLRTRHASEKFYTIRILHEELGLKLCPDADDAVDAGFECLAPSGPHFDVVDVFGKTAFKNPDVQIIKLLFPFQSTWKDTSWMINMELEGEDFKLHVHATVDCGAAARRNSMKCAIQEGWPRLIRALVRETNFAEDDFRDALNELDTIQPQVVQTLLSVLPSSTWSDIVDFQRVLVSDGMRLCPGISPESRIKKLQGTLNHIRTRAILFNTLEAMPVGAIPNPRCAQSLLCLSQRHIDCRRPGQVSGNLQRGLANILKRITTRNDNLFLCSFPYSRGCTARRPSSPGQNGAYGCRRGLGGLGLDVSRKGAVIFLVKGVLPTDSCLRTSPPGPHWPGG
ncbi:hypothetical protein HDU96_009252 [Phlyctochytrium bullatum]|nr:hypothetical protein HDU96_009252 [Phlyctochytrium bullatum]